jgi:multicomponent Na+:H+ antiporter subunit D
MSSATLMLLAVAIPFCASVLIAFSGIRPNLREGITFAAAVAMFAAVAALLPGVLNGDRPETPALHVLPKLTIKFALEPLGMLFALIASFLWIVTSLYSVGYMRGNKEPRQTSFYACFALALGATAGIAFSANLFTMFLFYEMLTLVTYPLVTHKQTKEAIRAGRVYLGILLGASLVLFLPAIVWIYLRAGGDFQPGGIIADRFSAGETALLLGLIALGIAKAALMPLHRWLPAAMVAPTPVSALLHAVAVVKAGVFAILKIVVYIFGTANLLKIGAASWLVYLAGATIIIASAVALSQDNLKRRLAYSTISQLSYVVMASALLVPISTLAAALHIAAHAFGKITLFFAAGSIYTAAHKTEVSELDGIGRQMPWTMVAFAVGALCMVGVPPTAGFLSKWFLLGAAHSAQSYFAVGVLIASTLLSAGYFMPVVYVAFFRSPKARTVKHGEAPWQIVLAISITAAATLLLFFFPGSIFELARQVGGR